MTIYAPSSFAELESMLRRAVFDDTGPVAVRYPRGTEGTFTSDCSGENTTLLRAGGDITVVCYGSVVSRCLKAADSLAEQGIECAVYKINRVLPLDADEIIGSMERTQSLIMVEDACRPGGVGSRLLTLAAMEGLCLKSARLLDLGDGMISHGKTEQLFARLGMDEAGIVAAVREAVNEKASA
jgi:1-deoxy-D-xylulose-5-phosphate synthase